MTREEIESALSKYTVGIAGAGGLGSNCAMALVRSGIGHLVIADFDQVDDSNLNRQFYFKDQIGLNKTDALKDNLVRINPYLTITIHQVKLKKDNIPSIFQEVDLLIEAFDQAEEKAMLVEQALDLWPDRPLIIGSGMAGYGDSNSLVVRPSGNLYICGDEKSEISPSNPPLAPRVGIVAHMQANKAISILLNL